MLQTSQFHARVTRMKQLSISPVLQTEVLRYGGNEPELINNVSNEAEIDLV